MDAIKLRELGSHESLAIDNGHCPTCEQLLPPSLQVAGVSTAQQLFPAPGGTLEPWLVPRLRPEVVTSRPGCAVVGVSVGEPELTLMLTDGTALSTGRGCHPDPRTAILRAVTELSQVSAVESPGDPRLPGVTVAERPHLFPDRSTPVPAAELGTMPPPTSSLTATTVRAVPSHAWANASTRASTDSRQPASGCHAPAWSSIAVSQAVTLSSRTGFSPAVDFKHNSWMKSVPAVDRSGTHSMR